MRSEAELYAQAGTEYALAWEKMRAVWDFPPSLEVFRYEQSHLSSPIRRVSATELADRLIARWPP